MPGSAGRLILDDRLLIEHLLVGLGEQGDVNTTSYWYYWACRAAAVGAGGHPSGPPANLDEPHQHAAIRSLLALTDDIGIPDPWSTVPIMAELSGRHPKLNLRNLEAVATGIALDATLLPSVETVRGILPAVLDAEHLARRTVEPH